MMNETININLNDNTEDGRFSQTNTATDVVKTATQPKTAGATTTASTPGGRSVVRGVGRHIYKQTPVAPIAGKTQNVFAAASNPAGIALLALSVATLAYNQWRKREREQNEWRNTYARQYGVNSGENLRNMRTSIITRKIRGTPVQGRR